MIQRRICPRSHNDGTKAVILANVRYSQRAKGLSLEKPDPPFTPPLLPFLLPFSENVLVLFINSPRKSEREKAKERERARETSDLPVRGQTGRCFRDSRFAALIPIAQVCFTPTQHRERAKKNFAWKRRRADKDRRDDDKFSLLNFRHGFRFDPLSRAFSYFRSISTPIRRPTLFPAPRRRRATLRDLQPLSERGGWGGAREHVCAGAALRRREI